MGMCFGVFFVFFFFKVLVIHFKDTCDQRIEKQGLVLLHSFVLEPWGGDLRWIATTVAFLRLVSLFELLHVHTDTKT